MNSNRNWIVRYSAQSWPWNANQSDATPITPVAQSSRAAGGDRGWCGLASGGCDPLTVSWASSFSQRPNAIECLRQFYRYR